MTCASMDSRRPAQPPEFAIDLLARLLGQFEGREVLFQIIDLAGDVFITSSCRMVWRLFTR